MLRYSIAHLCRNLTSPVPFTPSAGGSMLSVSSSGEGCSKASRDSNESGALSFASARCHAAPHCPSGFIFWWREGAVFLPPVGRLFFFGIGLR